MSLNELDKFTRFFVQKSIQVIVQSRLGGERVRTACNPRGNDWFNLSIPDDREVTERTRKSFDTIAEDIGEAKLTASKAWQVCCEVSLKNSDGESLVLEYWLFSNDSLNPSTKAKASIKSDDVFTVYNRLTLLLKSIIALTRATPIYKISNSGQGSETFVICYRIFAADGPIDSLIAERDRDRYSRAIKLGSVACQCNRVTVSFSYRTNMSTCRDDRSQSSDLLPVTADHFKPGGSPEPAATAESDLTRNRKILAFASPRSECLS